MRIDQPVNMTSMICMIVCIFMPLLSLKFVFQEILNPLIVLNLFKRIPDEVSTSILLKQNISNCIIVKYKMRILS